MSRQDYGQKFKTSLLQFIDELIEQYPTYPILVMGRIYIKDRITPIQTIETFAKEVVPYSTFIERKNNIIFSELNIIYRACFGAKKTKDIKNLKKLWMNADDENKNTIWRWFDLFLSLSQKYCKKFMKDLDIKLLRSEIDKKYNLI
jgi:hypothetical protein